jgi:allantoin racemase
MAGEDVAMRSVLVLNPNSSPEVTEAIRRAADWVRLPGIVFATEQLDDGPTTIESDDEHRQATRAVVEAIRERSAGHDGVIIACHGDPGLSEARRLLEVPVLGIGETSMLAAAAAAPSFGLLTLGPAVVPRKLRQLQAIGLQARCAAVEPTGTGVLHAIGESADPEPYRVAARAAIAKGAGALVLGCAGMVPVREWLSAEVPVPVVEPVVATCLAAAGFLASPDGHNPSPARQGWPG